MNRLTIAAALLGLSVGSAAACDWQRSAEAKTDAMTTASVATNVPPVPASVPEASVKPEEK